MCEHCGCCHEEDREEEKTVRAYVPELDPGTEEIAVTKLIYSRLNQKNCLKPGSRESVAYRLAEIMINAKDLYMEVLPRLLECEEAQPENNTQEEGAPALEIFDELAGVRMALIHMRDLIADFDDAFMDAVADMHSEEDETDELSEDNFFEE